MAIKTTIVMLCVTVMNVAASAFSFHRGWWYVALAYSVLTVVSLLALLGTRRKTGRYRLTPTRRTTPMPMPIPAEMEIVNTTGTRPPGFWGRWQIAMGHVMAPLLSLYVFVTLARPDALAFKLSELPFWKFGDTPEWATFVVLVILTVTFRILGASYRDRSGASAALEVFFWLVMLGGLLLGLWAAPALTPHMRAVVTAIATILVTELIFLHLARVIRGSWMTLPTATVTLTASDDNVVAGTNVTLTWNSNDASQLRIEPLGANVQTGRGSITIPVHTTTMFRAIPSSRAGSGPEATVTVTVRP